MMSPEVIRALAQEAAINAAHNDETPFVYWDAAEVDSILKNTGGFPFPFLGEYVPEGWVKVDEHFVDSSGFGVPGEPALTVSQFRDLILDRIAEHSSTGWAITMAGQFQVYVGEFRKEGK